MEKKNFCWIFYISGSISALYFALLQFENPTIIGFCYSWLLLSAFLFWCGIKFRKGQSFKKWQKITIASCLAFGTVISSANMYFILNPRINDGTVFTEYVIILGGGIKNDGTLSKMPQKRLESAAKYLKANKESKAIVSGGNLKFVTYPEAPELARQLSLLGIEESRIIQEDKALDTIQNLYYSMKIIADEKNITMKEALEMPVTIVTSNFHLARAEQLAKRMGFKNVYGLSAQTPPFNTPNLYAREICSYIKLNLRIFLTGKPNEETCFQESYRKLDSEKK